MGKQQTAIIILIRKHGYHYSFTDSRDPKPRSREIFSFLRPETIKEWLEKNTSLRMRLLNDVPPLNPEDLPAKDLG